MKNHTSLTAIFIIGLFILFSCKKNERESLLIPTADFLMDTSKLIPPTVIRFTNLSKNGTSYFWDYGDKSTSTIKDSVHLYSKSGLYFVKLIVYNNIGKDSIIKELRLYQIYSINDLKGKWRINSDTFLIEFDSLGHRISSLEYLVPDSLKISKSGYVDGWTSLFSPGPGTLINGYYEGQMNDEKNEIVGFITSNVNGGKGGRYKNSLYMKKQ